MSAMKSVLSGLFWFLVNCLAFSTATLPFIAIERSMIEWGPAGYALLSAAAAAFVLMWLLIAASVLLERAGRKRLNATRTGRRDEPRRTARPLGA